MITFSGKPRFQLCNALRIIHIGKLPESPEMFCFYILIDLNDIINKYCVYQNTIVVYPLISCVFIPQFFILDIRQSIVNVYLCLYVPDVILLEGLPLDRVFLRIALRPPIM